MQQLGVGDGTVSILDEIVGLFVYKINQATLGITAVDDGPAGQFTPNIKPI